MSPLLQRAALILTILVVAPSRGAEALPVAAKAADCLALALYHEARTEGIEGMQAVAAVVLNRVRHPEFPDDICAVVTDGGEQPPCQFSWWCDGKSDRPTEEEPWQVARTVALEVVQEGGVADPTDGALFFHTTDMDNPWRLPRERTAEIGDHVFYR